MRLGDGGLSDIMDLIRLETLGVETAAQHRNGQAATTQSILDLKHNVRLVRGRLYDFSGCEAIWLQLGPRG